MGLEDLVGLEDQQFLEDQETLEVINILLISCCYCC